MTHLTIRELTKQDSLIELSNLLHAAYARLGSMGLNYTAVDQSVEQTRERCQSGTCFIALDGERIVGTMLAKLSDPLSECEHFRIDGGGSIHQFAVSPQMQGRGIGRALFDLAERHLRERGCKQMALDTAEQANHLIAQYQRWGFVRSGYVQWTGKVYRSIVMVKQLV
jgi:ribosomal protein S18 acetylase RimI-like enzyme